MRAGAAVTGWLTWGRPLSVVRRSESFQVPSDWAAKVRTWCASKPVVSGSPPWIFLYVRTVVSVTQAVATFPRTRVLSTVTLVSAAV